MVRRRGRPSGVAVRGLFLQLAGLWLICGRSRSGAEDDRECLKSFKSSVTDPNNYLANWDFQNRSVCLFVGVQCWNSAENRVMSLRLEQAGLSGPFSPPPPTCSSLTALYLSGNRLTGPLPSDLCEQLPYLTHLDLSGNLLEGSIPPDLAHCLFLNSLSLQHNRLSGLIPSQLASLPRLSNLDLSFNNLSGPIPSSFANGSTPLHPAKFDNNPLLCGPPTFPECRAPHLHRISKVQLLIGASIMIALLLFIALILKQFCSHGGRRRTSHLQFETHLEVTWADVQRATSFFSPANIVGCGGSSTVYKGRLLDGQEIAVKVLHNEEPESSQLHTTPKQLFLTELGLLGKLRHRNLVKVLGFFCDSERMAIILDYMPAGSLDTLLRHESATRSLAFGWKARLNILLGIAEGLAYLHNEYDGKLSVIHGDLKPGNVLLDEYMEAHIADFGIATFVSTINNCSVASSKGQVLPMPCWSLGYTAPECMQQGLVSRKGDVFSFGVIVLEMITGERPSSNKLKEGESLVEWVNKALVEGGMDYVIAPMLLSAGEKARWREDLAATLRMGCSCASTARANRPDMSEVVTFLRTLCDKLEENPTFQALDIYGC